MEVQVFGQVQDSVSMEIPMHLSGELAGMAGQAPSKEGGHLLHVKTALAMCVRENGCTHLCPFYPLCRASCWWHSAHPAGDGS